MLDLQVTGSKQEILLSRIVSDMDSISELRLSRLQQAKEEPSSVMIVVLFGYLVTMVYFGIYQPRPALVSLLSLYAVFVGVVIYLIIAFGCLKLGSTLPTPVFAKALWARFCRQVSRLFGFPLL